MYNIMDIYITHIYTEAFNIHIIWMDINEKYKEFILPYLYI